jgi:hypothetical protein
MIQNDIELQATQERIAYFTRLVAQMRVNAKDARDFQMFANSYLAEIEKMHTEVMEYLKHHSSELLPAEAA